MLMGWIGVMAQSDPQPSTLNPQPSTLNSQLSTEREYDVLFNAAMVHRQMNRHDAAFDLLSRCIELRPDASESHYFLAQYYAEMNWPQQALEHFKRAADLEPDNMTYLETLASAYINENRYADATAVVEHMTEVDKGRDELLEMLYRLYIQEKDYEKAIGVLDRMEVNDGKSERTSLAKSRLYVEMGNHEQALNEVRMLAEQYPNDMDYRTIYANTLMLNDREDEAFDELRHVLSEEPNNVRAQLVLRNLYVRQENAEAADSVTHAMLINPQTPSEDKINQLRQIIMDTEQTGGDSTMVVTLFDEVLDTDVPDVDIAELKAAYMDLKKMPAADVAQAFEDVLLIAPDRASSRLFLVQSAWERKDYGKIVSLCQAARQYNPEEMAFYYYQGMAYYIQHDTDHALDAFQNGLNVISDTSNPAIVSDFYAVMGDLLHQKGRTREAFEAYDSCLQWKDDNVGCLNNYAYFLSLRGEQLDKAEQMSYRTVKAEPENPTYLDTYAWILFVEGRYSEARVYIDQALQHYGSEEQSADILEHAGDIYAMCGDTDEAVRYWNAALDINPDNKLLTKKIKRKKYLKK